jgi:iron complex transport system permease protein
VKRQRALAVIFVLAGATFVLAPFLGGRTISPFDLFKIDGSNNLREIFWMIRAPRVILAFLAGSALALSGLAFQAIFRNPLATPFTLGVSAGASLGASLYVVFGVPFTFLKVSGVSLSAFAGAASAIALVYGLTRVKRGVSTVTMLLAGVAVSFCFSSVILFLQYTADFRHSYQIVRWLMGGLETVGYESIFNVLPFAAIGGAVLLSLCNELNLMTTGDDIAASRGVDVKRTKLAVFFAASLMIGGVVSACGPIGFVGMMVPHICRLLIGLEHRLLAPATLAFGGAFLAICDTIARAVISPAEMPVGIITALLGGPFFLWLLMTSDSLRRSDGRAG